MTFNILNQIDMNNELNPGDNFQMKAVHNNSNCKTEFGGPHANVTNMDSDLNAVYRVKKIHYGGIYDMSASDSMTGKGHVGTIETACGCFIRYYRDLVVKGTVEFVPSR